MKWLYQRAVSPGLPWHKKGLVSKCMETCCFLLEECYLKTFQVARVNGWLN
uniref:Uncharacterized protein n=1 Tax=Picea glauca TaxID=3330 RepID=A0A101M350_PICGL|nr:hypothetical protein ABT39_MTgene3384 [Picea glauca]